MNPHGFALHFGGVDYGTHPEGKQGAHALFQELSTTLTKTLTEFKEDISNNAATEKLNEVFTTFAQEFNTYLDGFQEKNNEIKNKIAKLLQNLKSSALSKENFNELRTLVDLKSQKDDPQANDLRALVNALKTNNYKLIEHITYSSNYIEYFKDHAWKYKEASYWGMDYNVPFSCVCTFKADRKLLLYVLRSQAIQCTIRNAQNANMELREGNLLHPLGSSQQNKLPFQGTLILIESEITVVTHNAALEQENVNQLVQNGTLDTSTLNKGVPIGFTRMKVIT